MSACAEMSAADSRHGNSSQADQNIAFQLTRIVHRQPRAVAGL